MSIKPHLVTMQFIMADAMYYTARGKPIAGEVFRLSETPKLARLAIKDIEQLSTHEDESATRELATPLTFTDGDYCFVGFAANQAMADAFTWLSRDHSTVPQAVKTTFLGLLYGYSVESIQRHIERTTNLKKD